MIKKILFLILLSSNLYAITPKLFFSDFTDAPITGWEGSATKGAAVTIWGLNFGTTRGTNYVTVGGVNLTSDGDYAEWGVITSTDDPKNGYTAARGLEHTTFWLNSSMSTGAGTISVTVDGVTTNTVPFYCRALGTNHIYFFARDGDDTHNGLYSAHGAGNDGSWLKVMKIRDMLAGDIAYFRTGIWNECDTFGEGYSLARFSFESNSGNGEINKSISVSSYPGEIAQLGDNSVRYFLKSYKKTFIHWTFSRISSRTQAGFLANGTFDEGSGLNNLRIVGVDGSTCDGTTSGFGGVLELAGGQNGSTNFFLLGNNFHDIGVDNRGDATGITSRVYPLYITGYGTWSNIEIAWNEFQYCEKGRVQFYGHWYSDSLNTLYFHDNYIHDMGYQGVIIGGGDSGGQGSTDYEFIKYCYFYNNIISTCAQRADSLDSKSLQIGGESWGGHGGRWYLWNNTFYEGDEGEIYVSDSATPISIVVKNNIIYPKTGENYYDGLTGSFFSGSNNCYYNGTDEIPAWDSSTEFDPVFVDTVTFSLQAGSPCIGAGIELNSSFTTDYTGKRRGTIWDIGSNEYAEDNNPLPEDTPVKIFNGNIILNGGVRFQ